VEAPGGIYEVISWLQASAFTFALCHYNWVHYDVLNILEFNSTRKRMSAIVRTPEAGGCTT
jgi:magnesium-transporting ATPase (P-type)